MGGNRNQYLLLNKCYSYFNNKSVIIEHLSLAIADDKCSLATMRQIALPC